MADAKQHVQRSLRGALDEALGDTPVVCLLGARQCGKSTLAESVASERAYLSFDDANYLSAAAADPVGFVGALPDPVTLDEVQRVPEILLAIKRSVDADRRPGRFLLTGSANLLQLPRLADSLAGRMECLHLHAFTESEKGRSGGRFLGDWLAGNLEPELREAETVESPTLPERIVAGGYPEPNRRTPARARQWHRQYLNSIIERDIQDVARVKEGGDVTRLLELLAHRSAQLLNVSSLANDLHLDRLTVERYVSILEKLFLVRRLPAWHRNSAKRLVKTPKVYVCDSGLASTLSDLKAEGWNAERARFGHLVETFIVQQLVAQGGWTDADLRFFHYRDKDKVEVDVVITRGSKIWGVEVKASRSVDAGDTKGLHRLAAQAGKDFQSGIVFYDGSSILPLAEGKFLAVPMAKLWEM